MTIDPTSAIHPSSVIDEGATVGAHCRIGPFCHIGPDVRLGDNVDLLSHVVVAGHTTIGEGTKVWPFASVGHQPQDLKFHGEQSYLEIGARCMIRESVSINPGTEGGGGITRIGDDCLFMLGSHVGHDCQVGNRVVMANHASLAGHVEIGDDVIIGGLSGIHQFCKVGRGAVIGAVAMVANDVIPYGAVVGERPDLAGLNLVGLKRRGVDKSSINGLRAAFGVLFAGDGNLKDRMERVTGEHGGNPLVAEVLEFLRSDSKRAFLMPRNGD